MSRANLIRIMLLIASVLLALGLVGPCMTVQPSMGATFDTWLRLLRPDELEPTTYSILGGIMELMRGESLWLGILLLAFSAIFPTFKLSAQFAAVSAVQRGGTGGRAAAIAHHAGKYSMLDVMVIAVILITFKGLPGESTLTLHWGLLAFASSVVLSIVASLLMKGLGPRPSPEAQATDEGAS